MQFATLIAAVCLIAAAFAVDNGVGRTPGMGYSTWNDLRCDGINAVNVMAVADKMFELGLHFAGYEYVNIDDCWAVGREPNTNVLIPDPTAFPNGMKPVADYVHSLGLKFGIYTDRGTNTCAGRPGSQGYELIDAQTFASWGVDYVKEDSCNAPQDPPTAFAQYATMRDALNSTGRPIYFSLCGWNSWYAPEGQSLGNSWRIAGDCNQWPSVYNAIITNQVLANYSGPGGWNDPDMLVGSSTQAAVYNTPDQSRTQFSLWAIMAAPLIIGSNMLNMTAYDLQTYTNTEVIAIDQDPLGVQGQVIWENCPSSTLEDLQSLGDDDSGIPACQQIWSKPLLDGSWGVAFVNYDNKNNATVTCDETCFGSMNITQGAVVRDLWAHENLGTFTNFAAEVNINGGSRTFRFTPVA